MATKQKESSQVSVVTGVIGIDAHIMGNWVINYVLERAGFKVHRLGGLVSQEEFIHAALETDAKAIIISSLYGMASIDCQGLREKCDEAGLDGILLYIGGNLSADQLDPAKIQDQFKSLGFNRVYHTNANLDQFIEDLKHDLKATHKPRARN